MRHVFGRRAIYPRLGWLYIIPLEASLLKPSPADIRKLCVCPCTQKTANRRFFPPKRCLTNIPRRRRQADDQLSLLYPPSPGFSSFGAAYVMMCCFPPTWSCTPSRPSVYYPSSLGLPRVSISKTQNLSSFKKSQITVYRNILSVYGRLNEKISY